MGMRLPAKNSDNNDSRTWQGSDKGTQRVMGRLYLNLTPLCMAACQRARSYAKV